MKSYFLRENTPKVVDNIFLPFRVHKQSGLRAGPNVPASQSEVRVFMVVPEEAKEWAEAEEVAIAPTEVYNPPPLDPVLIVYPRQWRHGAQYFGNSGQCVLPRLSVL